MDPSSTQPEIPVASTVVSRNMRRKRKKITITDGPLPVPSPAPPTGVSESKSSSTSNSRGRGNRGCGRGGRNRNQRKKQPKNNNDELPELSTPSVKSKKKRPKEDNSQKTEQTVHQTKLLKKGEYECVVCCERINKKAGIWNCDNCYTLFHINCIQKWSRASDAKQWACPACRVEVKGKAKAHCFCGKVTKPDYDPYLVPHSCGDACGRKRKKTTCPHKCNIICHPGACPPCPAIGKEKKCFCKKTVYRLRCGEEDEGKSCSNVCGALLNCNLHKCKDPCHPGDCTPCNISMARSCYCGEVRKSLLCGEGKLSMVGDDIGYFSCEKPCAREISCGNHSCTLPCHPDACVPCESGIHVTTCHCGSVPLSSLLTTSRTSCLDPIPSCHAICGKRLTCGHTCKAVCHPGKCGDCPDSGKVMCRCGGTEQTVPCIELYPNNQTRPIEILCKTPCSAKWLCGRHRCREMCCPMYQIGPDAHPCPLTCGKHLSCSNHKCEQPCHRGPCSPCLNASFDELACHCGKTIMFPPIPCNAVPPTCTEVCSREHLCDHPPTHNCHLDEECPKCYALTVKLCGCGSKKMTTKCYVAFPCCGELCKKPLKCGIHSCSRACHGGSCEDEALLVGESCTNPCGAPLESCDHRCKEPCHPGVPCANTICEQQVTLRCPCGNQTEQGKCLRGGPEGSKEKQYVVNAYTRLSCDDDCVLKIRQQQLAVAFGRSNETPDAIPNYCLILTNAAVSNAKFVSKIELTLERFIASPMTTHRFPPMNSYYRSIIHYLAEYYKVESVSYDHEPYRNVMVTKTPRSSVPKVSLSDLVSCHPVPLQPGTGEGINTLGKPSSLLFYDLTTSIRTEHLHEVLRPYKGEYFLKWIDDGSAVATFNNEQVMKRAAHATSTYNHLKSTPCVDSDVKQMFSEKEKKREEETAFVENTEEKEEEKVLLE